MSSDVIRLPGELRRALERELEPGERIRWAGQPDWRAEWGTTAAIGLFGLGWSAIAIIFTVQMMLATLGLIPFKFDGKPASQWVAAAFLPFLIPFLAIGGWTLWWPWRTVSGAGRKVHAVTDRRLITVEAGRRTSSRASVESHPLSAVNFVRRKDRAGGTGTLEVGYGIKHDADGDPRPLTLTWAGVPDAARAEAAMLARQSSRSGLSAGS